MTRLALLTRPVADSERCAKDLKALGWDSFVEPMLSIETLRTEWPDADDFSGLVVTSAHALYNAPRRWLPMRVPVFAVGEHTAECARQCGFEDVRTAEGTASALQDMVRLCGLPPGSKLLHVCGTVSATPDVPGISIARLPVYAAHAATAFSAQMHDLLDKRAFDAAFFYSPRTAAVFAGLVEQYGRTGCFHTTKALCLSEPVVQSVCHLPWQDVRQAARPRHTAMLDLLGVSFS